MSHQNVCVAYTKTINGKEQVAYHKVGVLKITENGGMFLKLYHQPYTEYRIFTSADQELPTIT